MWCLSLPPNKQVVATPQLSAYRQLRVGSSMKVRRSPALWLAEGQLSLSQVSSIWSGKASCSHFPTSCNYSSAALCQALKLKAACPYCMLLCGLPVGPGTSKAPRILATAQNEGYISCILHFGLDHIRAVICVVLCIRVFWWLMSAQASCHTSTRGSSRLAEARSTIDRLLDL